MKKKKLSNRKKKYKKKYSSLMEFAVLGGEDEVINLDTLIATKKKDR